MDLGLKGRTCVVLGASRGIGKSIACGLAAEGADVAICARTDHDLREAEIELRSHGGRTFAETADVGDPDALRAFLDRVHTAFGSVDVLVSNASALATGPDQASWEACLQVDLMAAVHATDHVLPWMTAARRGSILFVSSISGLEASPSNDFAYTTIKASLIAYAKKLAVLQAPHGIRVNSIAPGAIEFPGGVWDRVRESQPAFYDMVKSIIPSGRYGTPEEVADVAVFLVSDRARWVTGACVPIDGGQHRALP